MKPAAILFDAYGTLLDVGSVVLMADELFPGRGAELARLWREKQLQYSWLRTLSNRYADFWQVTGEALDFAVAAGALEITTAQREMLMGEYKRLAIFPDVAAALGALAEQGYRLAVLSNGTPEMLEAAFASAGLRDHFAALLSVDRVRAYKTAPAAYQMAVDHFRGAPSELVLVSSNGWDIAGAAGFGLRTFWVNRSGAPVEQLGVSPSAIGSSLADLPIWLADAQTPT